MDVISIISAREVMSLPWFVGLFVSEITQNRPNFREFLNV